MVPRPGLTPYRRRVLALDDLCRTVVMVRAGASLFTDEGRKQWWGKCEKCSKLGWLQWSHYYSRAIHAVRWDLDNSCAMDKGCHFSFSHGPRQKPVIAWWEARLGPERARALELRAGRGSRRPDPMAIELYLRAALAHQGVGGVD
jgi:hypothetical protein